MRKIITLQLAVLSLFFTGLAQTKTGKISGTIKDGGKKTIESATIMLLKASDSSTIKLTVANGEGQYQFDGLQTGQYLVAVTAVGHNKEYSKVVELTAPDQSVVLETIELVPVAKTIEGVVVTSKKPFIEVKPGKTMINVESSPTNAGLNALELLEKSPGVTVDNDGNISLKGKQGVLILIDGKPTYMSGTDLTNLLKNMPSSNLDQLEIMTNPPAKYDAAGNSGIINIKTKKNIVKGMNGNVNLGFSKGIYGRTNNGINLNYRNNKVNIFGGYNVGNWKGFNKLIIDRNFYKNGVFDGSSDQISRPSFQGVYHSGKVGVDYYFSKKDILGFVTNISYNDGPERPWSRSNIRDNAGNIISKLHSQNDNNRLFVGITNNLNYKHTFDSTGREISADFDYAFYDTKSKTELTTSSFDANDVKVGNDVMLRGNIPSQINIYSAKVDYIHPFKGGYRLEAGLKSSYVETDNKAGYLRNAGTGWHEDDRSNHFLYKENINAAYAILSKSFKNWSLNAGLRMENTIAKGHQVKSDSLFKRSYTNLFPNLGIGYEMNEKNQFNLSYSRRITRPDYDALNPFVYFLDSLTYNQGNPYLQPQFTHNFELSHTFNRFLTTTVNYTQTNDIIAEMLKQDTEKKLTYQTRENFGWMKQLGVAVTANFPVQKWWNTNIYLNVFNNHFNGLYHNDPVDIQFTSFLGNVTNSFVFGKKKTWSAELSGWYRSKTTEGLLVSNPLWAVNSAVTKQVFKKKGTIKMGVRDIFWTQAFSGYAKYGDVDVKISSRRDSRQFNISFTYRFGKTNIAPARRKTGGAFEEQNRVNTGEN